ncbi:MAG TPA: (2Fe-2S)-binding protein [Thermoclostridium sp.]|nr:(2Fe-2S)-binding protein [Thermoclostridium sp.]
MPNDSKAIVCLCEEISIDEIKQCIADGCRTINEIKYKIRAGMGPCQGRTCRMLIAQEICKAYNVPLEEVLMPAYRVPAEPISIDALADACINDRSV